MQSLLLSSTIGILWLALLFILCFLGVHVLRLMRMGETYRKSKVNDEKAEDKPTPPPPQPPNEPVYYIVERKNG